MSGPNVIYEVNLDVSPQVARDFEPWLQDHVRQMLALEGFRSASVFRVRDESEREESPRHRYTVQYLMEDQAALDRYLASDAPRMRQEGLQRFGQHLLASRRILSPGQSTQLVLADNAQHCLNCHAPLAGQYCAHCGQRSRNRLITLWELVRDVLGDLIDMDSRLWRSLVPLLLRPGVLTQDYLLGRRARYIPPFRMYLILSLLFFLLVSSLSVESNLGVVSIDDQQPGVVLRIDPDAGEPGEAVRPAGEAPDRASVDEDCQVDEFNVETGIAWIDGLLTRERVEAACRKIKADEGRSLIRALLENVPTTLFFFLPLIALALKLLYPLSGKYYVEHLLFVLHFHAFAFLILSLDLVTASLLELAGLPTWPITTLVSVYMPVYLYRSMRRVYQQGTLATLLKYVLILAFYFFSLLMTLAVTTALTALTL